MSRTGLLEESSALLTDESIDEDAFGSNGTPIGRMPTRTAMPGVVVGELLGLSSDDLTPLVAYPGQSGSAAVRAQTVVDLHGAMVGRAVVLMFAAGDLDKPIVMGILRTSDCWPLPQRPAQVSVEADGERLVVNARNELVLRCGRASITLTKAGKVLIQGTYVSNRSSGVMRIKGGSIELN